ncbi:MAG: HelD family protein [Acidimicrobiales bacterium]
MREAARQRMAAVLDQGRGGTPQAKTERDMTVRSSLARLTQLDLGDRPLCFGRIDTDSDSYHIGRLPVSAADSELLVVDWRAPVAAPFYRATGAEPMGLHRRRHFASEGRRLVGIEDELFAEGDSGAGEEGDSDSDSDVPSGALLAAMSRSRSGYLRDIVATVQREQDEIIRAPLPGILVVQGGPGTGKTVVALHRAAYLLYTHRFPLESQGVLVIGPNREYLRYIEQVLPSLGENGVASSTVEGLLNVPIRGVEPAGVAHIKGTTHMCKLLIAAVRSRQRPLRGDLAVPYGSVVLRVSAAELERLVQAARRRPGTHNARRPLVEAALTKRLAADYERARTALDQVRPPPEGGAGVFDVVDEPDSPGRDAPDAARDAPEPDPASELPGELRRLPGVVAALDRMWPRLSAEELLHDLFGAKPLLALACKDLLGPAAQASLYRPRADAMGEIAWTRADIALLDEAAVLLGPLPGQEAPRAFGHIVVDEAQDLSAMQLRMLARRSISGSMTLVGDIAQATGPHAASAWSQITGPLDARREPHLVELSVNYRTPAQIMALAALVLASAAPGQVPPRSARSTGGPPTIARSSSVQLVSDVVITASHELAVLGDPRAGGNLAVIAPATLVAELRSALLVAGMALVSTSGSADSARASVITVDEVKGLEFDSVIVVEPALIVAETGLRALYVALTRPTRRLSILHHLALPAPLHDVPGAGGLADVSRRGDLD